MVVSTPQYQGGHVHGGDVMGEKCSLDPHHVPPTHFITATHCPQLTTQLDTVPRPYGPTLLDGYHTLTSLHLCPEETLLFGLHCWTVGVSYRDRLPLTLVTFTPRELCPITTRGGAYVEVKLNLELEWDEIHLYNKLLV